MGDGDGEVRQSVPPPGWNPPTKPTPAAPPKPAAPRARPQLLAQRRFAIGAVGLAVLAGVVVLLTNGGAGKSPIARQATAQSPQLLLTAVLANASARRSVHVTQTGRLRHTTDLDSDDLTIDSGRQVITTSAGGTAQVLLIGSTAYIAGNHLALLRFFGLTSHIAAGVDGRWLRVPSSSPDYSAVVLDVTLPSQLSTVTPRGQLTETAPTTIDGQRVIGIKGRIPQSVGGPTLGTLTEYVTATSTPLPVRAIYRFGNGVSAQVTFSRWGEHLSLHAPANVISAQALRALGSTPAASDTDANDPAHAWLGTWQAVGRVVNAHDSADQVRGETIVRLWLIGRPCGNASCPLFFERQTAGHTAATLGNNLSSELVPTRYGWRMTETEPNV